MKKDLPTVRFAVISEGVYSWPLYVAEAHGLEAAPLHDLVDGLG